MAGTAIPLQMLDTLLSSYLVAFNTSNKVIFSMKEIQYDQCHFKMQLANGAIFVRPKSDHCLALSLKVTHSVLLFRLD